MESLYTTHNSHFDKHPIVQNLTLNLTGKSILFDESTPSWRQRRKGLSPAFYKGKLQGLIEISKKSVSETVKHLENQCVNGPVEIDMISEISKMMTSLLL